MSEVAEKLNEALEKAHESKLNTIIALCVAVIATFMALCNVKASNIVQQMSKEQANAVDQWSYFQSKSTKQHVAESALDQIELQRDTTQNLTDGQKTQFDDAIKKHKDAIAKYDKEKTEIQKQAKEHEENVEKLDVHNDQFDMGEALMSVAIALFGVTALTQKRFMMFVAGAFAAFGMFMGLAGFMKLAFHPEFLAKLLT
ncbi:MAG TPA: DUF4337 domain-containing protein [Polyangiaceae bacterium]|jgi:hypothetical protein|nr:DUF4337 domain-containing protein [Polyangiaceae bacterium]